MQEKSQLTKEEILKVAQLAHIAMTDEEAENFQSDLSAILAFVRKLEELPIEGIDPTSHVGGIPAALRNDEARITSDKDAKRIRGMVEQFPTREDNYLQVPSVFSAPGGQDK